MTAPGVTVLLPVFDAGRHLDAAIASVLGQSLRGLELVVVDDGSRDGSAERAAAWAARDARVRLLRRPHAGIVAALNTGLGAARGTYVARMDADDRSHPERLARQVDYLEAHPECVALGCAMLEIDAEGLPIGPRAVETTHEAIESVLLSGLASGLPHATCVMRRAALDALGGAYRDAFRGAEDLDLLLRLGERGRLANLAEPLYEVRRHPASATRRDSQARLHALKAAIVREARGRRGLPARDVSLAHGDRELAPWEYHQRFARHAAHCGNRRTARKHATAALRRRPWSPTLWRLALKVTLGTLPERDLQYSR